jgi:hypothetical protein
MYWLRLLLLAAAAPSSRAATISPLDGSGWQLCNTNGSTCVQASVPGSIPLSLFAAQAWPDPYFGFNQRELNRSMSLETNWSYTRTFAFADSSGGITELVAKQLATVAAVTLNGEFVGQSVDSLLEQRWPLRRGLLQPRGNVLTVHIGSSWLYAITMAERAKVKCDKFLPGNDCMTTYVRQQPDDLKLRDNDPAFPNAGILDSIFLRTAAADDDLPFLTAVVPQVYAADGGDGADGEFRVNVRVLMTLPRAAGRFELRVRGDWPGANSTAVAVCGDGCGPSREKEVAVVVGAHVADELRWWPNGMGRAQLYTITVRIAGSTTTATPTTMEAEQGWAGGAEAASGTVLRRRIGFRTVRFVGSVQGDASLQPKHNEPPLFFRVNGVRIWAKGANYIHARALSFATQHEEREHALFLLDAARDANLCFVRVWGGNGYQYQYFYDRADENGLLLWHDAPFTGKPQPTDPAFLSLVVKETRYQARRLIGHASVALLSSNNEQDWSADPALFIGSIMATFQEEAGNASVALWPSSPSYGWQSLRPLVAQNCSDRRGDTAAADSHPSCVGHDLHYYMPKQELCRAMAKSPPKHAHVSHPVDFSDAEVNLVGETGWGPSFPLIDSWEKVSPASQLHLNSSLVRFRNVVRWTEQQDAVMRKVFAHVPSYNNWACAGTQGCPKPPPDAAKPSITAPRSAGAADLARYSFLTQALQARCVSWQREEHRRRPLNAGSLYWSLNSVWTAPTWGHIESSGRFKMAYHSVARVDAAFSVYATITPNAELLAAQSISYPSQSWLRIDAHNDHAHAVHARCRLQLLRDDGALDGSAVLIPPALIGAGGQILLANISNSCPARVGCLGVVECNASAAPSSDQDPTITTVRARHDIYPETLRHLHTASSYSISGVSRARAGTGEGESSGGCSMSLTADTLSLLTYIVTSPGTHHGNFVDNGFLMTPGVAQRLTFLPTNASAVALDCERLVASLLVYSANNGEAVKPMVR